MFYLKNTHAWSMFRDPKSKVTIVKDQIVAVEHLTDTMKKRIREGGLLKATEEEYLSKNSPEPSVPAVINEEAVAPSDDSQATVAQEQSSSNESADATEESQTTKKQKRMRRESKTNIE